MDRRFLDALQCRNEGRAPVWLMRQAGRYLPEYRALRAKHSFEELSHIPELIAQATCTPFARFPFDAAILFSDILLITEAIGKTFHFHEQKGPVLDTPLRDAGDVDKLPSADLNALSAVLEGIHLLIPVLKIPLIGFCGGPFTVASYLIEGSSSRDLRKTKKWLYQDPESFHRLLNRLTEMQITYLKMQIAAGVSAVQVFDSWAYFLPEREFNSFVLPYLSRIVREIEVHVPVILFCRGSSLFAKALATAKPACISVDFSRHLADVRQDVGPNIALQGNLDPDLLASSPAQTALCARELLKSMRGDKGYIFNLGHGVLPETPLESVERLLEAVHETFAF